MTAATITLTDFLLQRIAEDEAVARAAISATGESPWQASSYRVVVDDGFEVADASVPSATHIARHDPARVLAECAAKRAIVECATDQHTGGIEFDSILRALASVYADHESFDPRWTL
jgi:hypothetical protein